MESQESVAVLGPLEAELRAALGEAARVPHGLELLIETTKIELNWTRDWDSLAELQQALEVW